MQIAKRNPTPQDAAILSHPPNTVGIEVESFVSME